MPFKVLSKVTELCPEGFPQWEVLLASGEYAYMTQSEIVDLLTKMTTT